MIDKGAWIGMHGAQNAMHRLKILTNNLANVNTTGYRSDHDVSKQYQLNPDGMQTRVYASVDSTYTNFGKGPMLNTGRELDIAVSGEGFIAVQSKSGKEAYTRAGSLDIGPNGTLVTSHGEIVMGTAGVITIQNAERVSIGKDGTVSAKMLGTTDIINLGRIKITNPEVSSLKKGADGLFYASGSVAQDPNARVLTGTLEGSNVNPINTLTELIDLTRNYEIHTNLLKNLSENASVANHLLDLPK